MRGKRILCALLLAGLLATAARADVLLPGQKPPRNPQSEAFVRLYAEGLTGWDSAYDQAFDQLDTVVLWRYPKSGEERGTVSTEWFQGYEKIGDVLGPCYRDPEGEFWAYLNYAYGRRMSWICVSDPTNAHLPADPAVTAAVDRAVWMERLRENAPAIVLAGAAVAVTAVLLLRLRTKRRPSAA